MSRQLELDINRPSWAETDFRSEVKDLWRVRKDYSTKDDRDSSAIDDMESSITVDLEEKKVQTEL